MVPSEEDFLLKDYPVLNKKIGILFFADIKTVQLLINWGFALAFLLILALIYINITFTLFSFIWILGVGAIALSFYLIFRDIINQQNLINLQKELSENQITQILLVRFKKRVIFNSRYGTSEKQESHYFLVFKSSSKMEIKFEVFKNGHSQEVAFNQELEKLALDYNIEFKIIEQEGKRHQNNLDVNQLD